MATNFAGNNNSSSTSAGVIGNYCTSGGWAQWCKMLSLGGERRSTAQNACWDRMVDRVQTKMVVDAR